MRKAIFAVYRIRGPLFYAAIAILVSHNVVKVLPRHESLYPAWAALVVIALGVAILCTVLAIFGPRLLPPVTPQIVKAPVAGRWLALNSPASHVPSHGVRAYGQAFAIDLVYEPAHGTRPQFGGPSMRDSTEYPAFGQAVFAMFDGTVVKASDSKRDHRARSNWFDYFYLLVEGMLREIGGPGFIVGNHVTIRSDDGVYGLVAHLQRGSVEVTVGERVTAGQQIGRCGNSGNSSEPHVHAQLMDRESLWVAQGIPMEFSEISLDDEQPPVNGLPKNGEHLIVA